MSDPTSSEGAADLAPTTPPALGSSGENEILRRVLEETARATGNELFRVLVRSLALALRVSHVLVTEVNASRERLRTLAFWGGGRFLPLADYELRGSPCEEVLRGELGHHPRGLRRGFPGARLVLDTEAESYVGLPLLDDSGQVIGHLALLDLQPMDGAQPTSALLRIFAARAAAELQRMRMQRSLIDSERRLRDLFDEAPIGYVYEDTHTRFVSANRAAQKMLGVEAGEVSHTVGLTLVANTEENQARLRDSMEAEQAGREKPFIELELRRKCDGKPVWVQRFSRPEPDGKYTRTMIIDITERVQAEQERARLSQQNAYLREEIDSEHNYEEIVGSSSGMRSVLASVSQVAGTDSTVLVLGETGTGKELVARALHSGSRRRDRPLIKLNCAALPVGLIESELFGHEKGAFTGAIERRVGRFALADGGTIFLDEIGEMPLDVQARLLRVLQEREFEPVGSAKTVRIDVRVIAATNRDLTRAVAEGDFRADLYYRLNVFPIRVPPLRERREDIPLLVHYFSSRFGAKIGRRVETIDPDTMRQLTAYDWPGNIRELANVIERAVILSQGGHLVVDPAILRAGALGAAPAGGPSPLAPLAESERAHVLAALERTRWRIEGQQGAAKLLGLHPNTLRSRMKKLGLSRPHESS